MKYEMRKRYAKVIRNLSVPQLEKLIIGLKLKNTIIDLWAEECCQSEILQHSPHEILSVLKSELWQG